MTDNQTKDGSEVVEQPTISEIERKKIKRKLRYLSKFHFAYCCAVIFCIFIYCAIYYFCVHYDKNFKAETFSFRVWGGLFVALAIGVGIIAIAYAIYPTKLYDSQKLSSVFFGMSRKAEKITFSIIYNAINVVAIIFLLVNIFRAYASFYPVGVFPTFDLSMYSRICVISHNISLFILFPFIIATVVIYIVNKKLSKSLISYGDKIDDIITEDIERKNITPFDLNSFFKLRTYTKKALIRVITVSIVYVMTIILIFCLTAFVPPYPFKRSSIDKLDIGYNIGYIYRMLGEPHDRRENTSSEESEREVTYGTWKWCSSGLAKQIATKTKQLEKLSEVEDFSEENFDKMGKLTEQILNLELELSMTKCDYVTVSFIDGIVTQVEFKKDYTEFETKEVSVIKILYSAVFNRNNKEYTKYSETPTVWETAEIKEVDLKMYLSDDSMIIKTVTFITPVTVDNPTENWSDEYGEHTFAAKFE